MWILPDASANGNRSAPGDLGAGPVGREDAVSERVVGARVGYVGHMSEAPRALPYAVARLVQAQKDIDIRSDLIELLERGQRRVTIGIGGSVDIPLLDQELHAAEIAMLDREVVIAAVRAEPDGYIIERGWSNFGVYVWCDSDPVWQSVPWMGAVRGLRPGDKVALGSAPAEALRFELPESALVPPPEHRRGDRTQKAASQQRNRTIDGTTPVPPQATNGPPAATPAAAPASRDPWAGITPGGSRRRTLSAAVPGMNGVRTPSGSPLSAPVEGRPQALRANSDKYQRRFDAAFRFWRYDKITIGDHRAVIDLDEPELQAIRIAIGRNLEHPERGYDVFVKEPRPEFWVHPAGEHVRLVQRGDVVRLRGAGNRIGFAGFEVVLPEPAVPVSRFGPRQVPTSADIAEVLGLPEESLTDTDRVKAAYRDLVRRFHPDMHDGDAGHLSRFLELQVCFDAWKKAHSSPS